MSARVLQHVPATAATRLTEAAAASVIRAVLVSDFVGSTALLEHLGDRRSAQLWSRVDRVFRDLLKQFSGREVDKTDGFLLLFERSLDAVCYAIAVHDALELLAAEEGLAPERLKVRIGIHVGEVVLRPNHAEDVAAGAKQLELEGLAKPLTARLMSLAAGGQTLLSRTAYELARRAAVGEESLSPDTQWLAHGQYLFSGVNEPQDVFEIGTAGKAPLRAPADCDKASRVVQIQTAHRLSSRGMVLLIGIMIIGLLLALASMWFGNIRIGSRGTMQLRVLKPTSAAAKSLSAIEQASPKSNADETIVEDTRTGIHYSLKMLHPDPN